jgi:hypothetical protein
MSGRSVAWGGTALAGPRLEGARYHPDPMTSCDHCAGRGWGLRLGFVRRCEVCCFYRSDGTARAVAERELARFALRERPTAHVPPDTGAMRCPWCNHLPTNEDIDTFWTLSEATCFAPAHIRYEALDECHVLVTGEDEVDHDTSDEIRLQCPNPSCGKTFDPPEELDFRLEPEAS